MNARARITLPTLTPVPQTVECETCGGDAEVRDARDAFKWGNDPSIRMVPCPEPGCRYGEVPNPDWEPLLMSCPCGHALLPTDSCRLCGAEYTGETA